MHRAPQELGASPSVYAQVQQALSSIVGRGAEDSCATMPARVMQLASMSYADAWTSGTAQHFIGLGIAIVNFCNNAVLGYNRCHDSTLPSSSTLSHGLSGHDRPPLGRIRCVARGCTPRFGTAETQRLSRAARRRAISGGHPFELAPGDQVLLTMDGVNIRSGLGTRLSVLGSARFGVEGEIHRSQRRWPVVGRGRSIHARWQRLSVGGLCCCIGCRRCADHLRQKPAGVSAVGRRYDCCVQSV
jgi:hypothetical protein